MLARSSLRGGLAAVVLAVSVLFLLPDSAPARDVSPAPAERPRLSDGDVRVAGGVVTAQKAVSDTVLVLGPVGSGAPYLGGFQDAGGNPAWNGWTSADLTAKPNHWHVDTYAVISGQYSAWCGENLPSCNAEDPAGGYGNNWDDSLEWRGTVADPAQPCLVDVSAVVSYDVELGYDYVYLMLDTASGPLSLWQSDGKGVAVPVSASHTLQPGDYVGAGGDEVVVYFRVASDGAWSDADCCVYTTGAMQVDDVSIALDNGTGTSWDFEDGTLGPFTLRAAREVGDFAHLWTGLEDVDRCATNYSPQVAFIDDGVVVPGTGGSPCINWCYGPGGWIVTTTGGLAGPDYHINDAVTSPLMDWPEGYDAADFAFTVYRHEDLSGNAPGIFYTWEIRSGPTADSMQPWENRNFVYYGGPDYLRYRDSVGDMLVPGSRYVQVRFTVQELGWIWGWTGDDGYPAPYFDDVRLAASHQAGPAMWVQEEHLAQDGFIAAGSFDPAEPGAASVRFDMAADIATPDGAPIDPGDSLVIDVVARNGAVVTGPPRMHYRLKANPAFDAYRTSGLPTIGSVVCDSVVGPGGTAITDRWAADLPDTGFFFPGDVLHYYFEAEDDLAGDVQTARLPADTTGFSTFQRNWGYVDEPYDRRFEVRALPSIRNFSATYGYHDQPDLLLWFDGRDDADWDAWRRMAADLCWTPGSSFDIYATRAASRGVGNGLGARATVALLDGYAQLAYSSGDLTDALGDGEVGGDPSPDVQLLEAWLDGSEHGFFASGDRLATSLVGSALGTAFLRDYLGGDLQSSDLRPLIGSQDSPGVVAVAGNPVFEYYSRWRAVGGCPTLRTFDAVVPWATGARGAEFTEVSGNPGGYVYAAALVNDRPGSGSRCVFLPYDLTRVQTDPLDPYPNPYVSANTGVLVEVLQSLGMSFVSDCVGAAPGAPAAARFATSAYPNPFNPRVRIDYAVARPGRLTVKIFDVRGRLVRNLFDGQVTTGGFLDWDGTAAGGARAASGVYFYEARMDDDVQVGRMMMIK